MAETPVIVDGLHDPTLARRLSAAWHRAGLGNRVDPAGQTAWLWRASDASGDHVGLDEADVDGAARIAMGFGVALRDRLGQRFTEGVAIGDLRRRVAWEYKSRFATALVFGLPALVLHYLGPMLAGAAVGPRSMALPWLFELLLSGWVCLAAALPMLVYGGAGLVRGRANGDALTLAVIALSMLGSVAGLVQLVFGGEPWFVGDGVGGPLFDVAVWAALAATAQRWALHAHADRLVGRGNAMMRGHRYFAIAVVLAVVLAVGVTFARDPRGGLALGVAVPTTLSLMAVNAWSPGWLFAVPVLVFAGLVGGQVIALDAMSLSARVEAGALFSLAMTGVSVLLWRRLPRRSVAAASNGHAAPSV